MSLFSIITITKNNPEGFARTRASVESQTCKYREWIVVDGNIEADAGIYDAMNKGLARAQGKYVVFMNAGDVFAAPWTLSRVSEYEGFDFLYGNAIENGHEKPARHNIAYGMLTHHQAMFYCRTTATYDTKYKIAADYKFTAQHLAITRTRAHMPFPVCIFEQGGISQRNMDVGRHEQAIIRREMNISAPMAEPLQMASAFLKKAAPKIYWMLRSA